MTKPDVAPSTEVPLSKNYSTEDNRARFYKNGRYNNENLEDRKLI